MGFPRFQPETSDPIQAPDGSMEIHHKLPTPYHISTVFITVAIPDHEYTDADGWGQVIRGAGQQNGCNFITNLPSNHSQIQHNDKVKHKSDTHISARLRRAMTADDPLRPLKTPVGSAGTICCNIGRNLFRACLWTSQPNSTHSCLPNKDTAISGRWPTWRAVLLYNTFTSILYMFRATKCSSSWG